MDLKLERRFGLKICVNGRYKEWIQDVIRGIEKETLLVFDPKRTNSFSDINRCDKIDRFIEEKATLEYSISEYLPLACQCIRFMDEKIDTELKKQKDTKSDISACYCSNIEKTILFPRNNGLISPSAFIGEILLCFDITQLSCYRYESEKPFKYLIAHELVHAFNHMRFIVPAFFNWDSFWQKSLNSSIDCSKARTALKKVNGNIDKYGTDIELKELQKYWPNNAEEWVNAWQDLREKIKKKSSR